MLNKKVKGFKMVKKKHKILKIILLVLAVAAVIFAGYTLIKDYVDSLPKNDYGFLKKSFVYENNPLDYPAVKFAVISDLHYYDISLGIEGSAFEDYMMADRKMLIESVDIIAAAIDDIIESDVSFVLLPGDLTKDGELINHKGVAESLARLKEAGIQAYVIPGNHDVNCHEAFSYDGDFTTPVINVSPEKFVEIYADYGYTSAIYRDGGSLNYIAEPRIGIKVEEFIDNHFILAVLAPLASFIGKRLL